MEECSINENGAKTKQNNDKGIWISLTISRRNLFLMTLGLTLSKPDIASAAPHPLYGGEVEVVPRKSASNLPPPESPINYPVMVADKRRIPKHFWRKVVTLQGQYEPNSIIVDPGRRYL